MMLTWVVCLNLRKLPKSVNLNDVIIWQKMKMSAQGWASSLPCKLILNAFLHLNSIYRKFLPRI